jgi:hypothetical protein
MKTKKKITLSFIVIWIVYIFLVISLVSCLGTKKIAEKKSVTKIENSAKKESDSSSVIEKNNAISDRIEINLPKTDNDDLLKLFNAAMSQLNTSKSSGSNSYTSRYDAELMKWIIDFKIGETANKQTDVKNNSENNSFKEITIEETFKKVISKIPWWAYVVAFIWFLPTIIQKVMFFISPVKSIITKINEK